MASSSSRYGAVPSDEAASAVSAIDDHTPEPSASRRRGPRVVLAAVASLMVCAVVVSRMASSSGGGGGGGGGGLAAGASSLARSERAVAGGAQTLVQKYKLQSTTMPLIGHLALTLSSDYWVQVSWHTTDGTSTVLWSEWKLAGNDTTDELSVQFYLPRLRSSTQYLVHVWAAPDRNNGTTAQKVAEYTYTNPSTGISEFDNGPLMNVSGTPTWEMIVTDRGISNEGTTGNWNEFGGFIAFDSLGYVVWYYDLPGSMYGCNWVQLANGDFVVSIESTPSGFLQINALGDEQKKMLVGECDSTNTHAALGYQMLNHEALINTQIALEPIITFKSEAVNLTRGRKIEADDHRYEYVKTDAVVEWNRHTNEVRTLFELTDFFEPAAYQPGDAQTGYSTIKCGAQPEAEDWTHANSISLDASGNVIVGVRNLNLVAAFKLEWDSGEATNPQLLWTLSNNSQWSDFSFDADDSKFFMAHHVRVRDDISAPGKVFLSMFDNGDSQPECNFMADPHQPNMHCSSRGLELVLDFTTMEAKKVWEYTPPAALISDRLDSLFAKAKGSVEMLSSGNRLVAYTASLNRHMGVVGDWWAFEVDSSGETLSWMYLSPCWKTNWEFPYRALQLNAVMSESSGQPPLIV